MKANNKSEIIKIIKAYLLLEGCASNRELLDFINENNFGFDDGITSGELSALLTEALGARWRRLIHLKKIKFQSKRHTITVYYLAENEEVVLKLVEDYRCDK